MKLTDEQKDFSSINNFSKSCLKNCLVQTLPSPYVGNRIDAPYILCKNLILHTPLNLSLGECMEILYMIM